MTARIAAVGLTFFVMVALATPTFAQTKPPAPAPPNPALRTPAKLKETAPATFADLAKPEELKEIATYADGIGPYKRLIVPEDANKALMAAVDGGGSVTVAGN